MDETALIAAAQRGEIDAFNRLVLAYQDAVFNLALRILADENGAADAAQNAFIAAYRAIKGFRGGSFKAWLMRIVTNHCYDELRRRKRRPEVPLEPVNDATEEEFESPAWLADDDPTPEEALSAKELELAIQSCLNQLPPEFRAVVVLVELEDLDYQDAARAAGVPVGTIKSRLARARLRLRDCLAGFWELLPAQFRQNTEANL